MNKKFNFLLSSFFLLLIVGSSHASNDEKILFSQEQLEIAKGLSKTFLTEEGIDKLLKEIQDMCQTCNLEGILPAIIATASSDPIAKQKRQQIYSSPYVSSEEKQQLQDLFYETTPQNNTMSSKQKASSIPNPINDFFIQFFTKETGEILKEKLMQMPKEEDGINMLLQYAANDPIAKNKLDKLLKNAEHVDLTEKTRKAIYSSSTNLNSEEIKKLLLRYPGDQKTVKELSQKTSSKKTEDPIAVVTSIIPDVNSVQKSSQQDVNSVQKSSQQMYQKSIDNWY